MTILKYSVCVWRQSTEIRPKSRKDDLQRKISKKEKGEGKRERVCEREGIKKERKKEREEESKEKF